jgi:hypothetical protein
MKVLDPKKTVRLLERLMDESRTYYQTLHDAKAQLQNIGPVRFDDIEQTFSDLSRWHDRLKLRFIVMAIIGRDVFLTDTDNVAGMALGISDQVFAIGEIKALLKERGDNV